SAWRLTMQNSSLRLVVAAVLTIALAQVPANAQLNDNLGTLRSRFASNPAPFQNNLAPISSPLAFFVLEKQRRLAANATVSQPIVTAVTANPSSFLTGTEAGGTVASPCNSAAGGLFNLEPATGSPYIGFPVPQNSV